MTAETAPSVGKRRSQMDALITVVGWASISVGSILLSLLVGVVSLEGLFRLAFTSRRRQTNRAGDV